MEKEEREVIARGSFALCSVVGTIAAFVVEARGKFMTRSKSGKARLRALLMSFAMPLAAGVSAIGGGDAFAQSQKPIPVIEAPSIFEFETGKISPMTILIKAENAAPQRAMLLIRGLPGTVALTEGRLFESGVWSVKLADLPNLKLVAPSSVERSNISLALVTLEGSILAEKSAILSIATRTADDAYSTTRGAAPSARPANAEAAPKPENTPRANSDAESVAAIPVDTPPAPAATRPITPLKPLTFEETEKIQVFMQKGEENMRSGNINLARLFYKRSADAGWAPGALALAGTYDAEELARMAVLGGIQPDAALAKKWYEAARDLGSATAQQKLQRLGQR